MRAQWAAMAVLAALPLSGCGRTAPPPARRKTPPAALFTGFGTLHHAIATSSPEAQQFFDQGLRLVYAFNFAEAIHSFQRAAALDPKSPMPRWGIALAMGPNFNSGAAISDAREDGGASEIGEAEDLEAGAPPNERAYVDALAARFSDDDRPDQRKLARDYSAAMRGLAARYPDDPDAATLYAESLMDLHAWRLWTPDGHPTENTNEILAVLEGVLARWPDHLGANHYYVHALEASPFPERALASALRLQRLAPMAGHIVHMAAHIEIRTGDYAGAVKSNQAAIAADKVYLAHRSIDNASYLSGYADHNYQFLAAAAEMDGDFDAAQRAATDLDALAAPRFEAFHSQKLLALLRFARWDDLLAVAPPDRNLEGVTYFWHFARGCAWAAKGQPDAAQQELITMEADFARRPTGQSLGTMGSRQNLNRLASLSLIARIDAARGDAAGAVANWTSAVGFQDLMPYHEPPVWYPVRESLGGALLRAGRAAEAETVFRDDLARNRGNPRSLFGLWQALAAQHSPKAAAARRDYDRAWKGQQSPSLGDL